MTQNHQFHATHETFYVGDTWHVASYSHETSQQEAARYARDIPGARLQALGRNDFGQVVYSVAVYPAAAQA